MSIKKKSLSCLFFDDVSCSFRKSEKSKVVSKCAGCTHYKRFVKEMEKEEEEFWSEADERDASLRCYCDGELCNVKPVGSCFGLKADSCELIVCPRFDMNRFPDGSMIKEEYLRLSGGDSAEH